MSTLSVCFLFSRAGQTAIACLWFPPGFREETAPVTDPSLGLEKEKTGHCLGLEASQGGWNLEGGWRREPNHLYCCVI